MLRDGLAGDPNPLEIRVFVPACGGVSWTMDRLFAPQEPHQNLIYRTNFLLDYLVVVAVWQSIAYLLESKGLRSQDPCILAW